MNRARAWEGVLLCGFWLVPIALLLARWHPPEAARPAAAEAGPPAYAWLSLPAPFDPGKGSLRGWTALAGPVIAHDAAAAMAAGPPPPGPDPLPPADTPFRLQLHGEVGAGTDTMYLFLDTETGRWVRLTPGQTDFTCALAIPPADGNTVPVVVDLRDGRLYHIRKGPYRLEKLENPHPDETVHPLP